MSVEPPKEDRCKVGNIITVTVLKRLINDPNYNQSARIRPSRKGRVFQFVTGNLHQFIKLWLKFVLWLVNAEWSSITNSLKIFEIIFLSSRVLVFLLVLDPKIWWEENPSIGNSPSISRIMCLGPTTWQNDLSHVSNLIFLREPTALKSILRRFPIVND